jgi:tetratricopeptide (TPR) repeat protein
MLPIKTAPRFAMEDYSDISVGWIWLAWIAGIIILIAIWLFRRRAPSLNFAIVWFVCTLSPAVMIASLTWYGFGRYLYLPMTMLTVGLFDFGTTIWRRITISRGLSRLLLYTGIVYLVLLGVMAKRAIGDYRDSQSFYQAIIRDYPDRSHGYAGAGRLLVEAKLYKPAILLLNKAIGIAPQDGRYWNNLAQAYLRSGDFDNASRIAKLAIRRFPRNPKFYHILAASMAASDPEASIRAALAALQLDPKRTATWNLLRELVTRHPRKTEIATALRRHATDPLHAAYHRKLLQLIQKNPP